MKYLSSRVQVEEQRGYSKAGKWEGKWDMVINSKILSVF